MPEIKNTFLEGKMNKDLDPRLLKNGEYIDAKNIQISKTDSSSVGTIQNIKGNQAKYSTIANRGTVIGFVADNEQKNGIYRIFYFVKGTGSYADNIYYYKADSTDDPVALINNGTGANNFLKFNTDYLITGVNVIDDFLIWTDNLNQPRKINVQNAIDNPNFYDNEDKISVAKYYPFTPPQVLKQNNSTDYTGMQKAIAEAVLDGAVTSSDTIVIADYNNDIFPGQELTFSGSAGIILVESVNGTTITLDQNVSIADATDLTFTSYINRIEEKFIRFAYRFKFIDGEYSLISPFTQHCFIPKTYNNSTGLTTAQITEAEKDAELDSFVNDVINVNLQIEMPTSTPKADLEIDKIEILFKESDNPGIKALALNDIDDTTIGVDKIYEYTYKSILPYKTLPEEQLTRVYDNVPVKAKAQEIVSNRIVYGNFVQNPKNKPYDTLEKYSFDYEVFFGDKTSTEPGQKFATQYPYSTIKTRRTYQVGIVLADKYGRQSPVFLSDNTDNSIVKVTAKNSTEITPGSWNGEVLKITFNKQIPQYDKDGVDVLYSASNPTGWYSYKIVVKQTEQDYYNIYSPLSVDGFPNASTPLGTGVTSQTYTDDDKRTWISLHGDNINKIPRDTTTNVIEEGISASTTRLFPKVINANLTYSSPNDIPMLSSGVIDVISVGTYKDHGLRQVDSPTSNNFLEPYRGFFQSSKNLLAAELKDGYGAIDASGSGTFNSGTSGLSVWETYPVESALDIYYETLTVGLISELNADIVEGSTGPTGLSFNNNTTTADFEEGNEAPYNLGNLKTVDSGNTEITSGLTYTLISAYDNADPTVSLTDRFEINESLGVYSLRTSQNKFYYGTDGRTYTLNVRVQDSNNNPAVNQAFTINLLNTIPDLVLSATTTHVHFNSNGSIFTPSSSTENGSADTDQDNIFPTNAYSIQSVVYDPSGTNDSSSSQAAKFTINAATGVVSANNHYFPTSEIGKIYRITVRVIDEGGISSCNSGNCYDEETIDVEIVPATIPSKLYGNFSSLCTTTDSQTFYITKPSASSNLGIEVNSIVYTTYSGGTLSNAFGGYIILTTTGGEWGDGTYARVAGGAAGEVTLIDDRNCEEGGP